MSRKTIFLLLSLSVALSGCGSSTSDRALSGGAIGAGAGALGGAAMGGSAATGAVLGGVTGAVVGGVTKQKDVDLGKPVWRK